MTTRQENIITYNIVNPSPDSFSSSNRRRGGDRVVLDVGGTQFVTSISTLQANSSYFKSKFSRKWYGGSHDEILSDDGNDEAIFIDQESKLFSNLLSYMRCGFIHVNEICPKLLALADFLGIDRLLDAVKYRSYRNCFPHNSVDTASEIIVAFDAEFGGIRGAISKGILPAALSRSSCSDKKEFVSFVVSVDLAYHESIPGGIYCGVYAANKLCVSSYDDSERGSRYAYIPNCRSFLDCINWLSANGFVQEERTLQGLCDAAVDNEMDVVMLSRLADDSKMTDENEDLHRDVIIGCEISEVKSSSCQRRYAMIKTSADTFTYVLADLDHSERLVHDVSGENLTTRVINIQFDSPDEAMTWLHRHSYCTRETRYEEIYKNALNKVKQSNRKLQMIFSRGVEPLKQLDTHVTMKY